MAFGKGAVVGRVDHSISYLPGQSEDWLGSHLPIGCLGEKQLITEQGQQHLDSLTK